MRGMRWRSARVGSVRQIAGIEFWRAPRRLDPVTGLAAGFQVPAFAFEALDEQPARIVHAREVRVDLAHLRGDPGAPAAGRRLVSGEREHLADLAEPESM